LLYTCGAFSQTTDQFRAVVMRSRSLPRVRSDRRTQWLGRAGRIRTERAPGGPASPRYGRRGLVEPDICTCASVPSCEVQGSSDTNPRIPCVATRRNRRKLRHSATASPESPPDLLSKAEQALERERFRDALDGFKALSKTEPPRVWAQGLAAAYRGRALELEAKGMEKEALTIWDNRLQACPGVGPDPRHLALLLRHGQIAPALAGYRELLREKTDVGELRARFAALYLGGCEGPDQLPPDDPVTRDGVPAAAALTAYCAGDDTLAARHLKEIPFRSPYRDFVTIIKALLTSVEDPTSGRLLERIAADSAFAPLASAARLALLPETDFRQGLAAAGQESQRFAMALRGWPDRRYKLWRELERLGDKPSSQQTMALLNRHRGVLGDAWVRRQAFLLVHHDFPKLPGLHLVKEL